MNTLVCIMMVGIPGCGKSTHAKALVEDASLILNIPFSIVSTDMFIESYAEEHNITYNDAFNILNFKDVERKMWDAVETAFMNGMNVIVDRTHLTPKSREKCYNKLKEIAKKCNVNIDVGVSIFGYCTIPTAIDRNNARPEGRKIAKSVMDSMISSFVVPNGTNPVYRAVSTGQMFVYNPGD